MTEETPAVETPVVETSNDSTLIASDVKVVEPTDWRSSLPDELKSETSLSNIKDIGSLAKSYVNAQKMLGGRIPIPTKDASPEVIDEFYKKVQAMPGVVKLPDEKDGKFQEEINKVYDKLGRPKTANDYKLDFPEKFKGTADSEFLNNIKNIAHQVGLNQKQLDALAKPYIERSEAMITMMGQAKENTKQFLLKEWGNAFQGNLEASKGVMHKYAQQFPESVQELMAGPSGNNPVLLMMAAELGNIYRQKGTIAPHGASQSTNTPEMAKQHIAEIFGNKGHPYHDRNNPAHESAVAKMQSLYRDAYPDEKNVK